MTQRSYLKYSGCWYNFKLYIVYIIIKMARTYLSNSSELTTKSEY